MRSKLFKKNYVNFLFYTAYDSNNRNIIFSYVSIFPGTAQLNTVRSFLTKVDS